MENKIAFIEGGIIVKIINATMEFANTLEGQKLEVTGVSCGIGFPVVDGVVGHPDDLLTEQELQQRNILEAMEWRDRELKDTDWIVPVTDHTERESYMLYRVLLRDWTEAESFPKTKPVR